MLPNRGRNLVAIIAQLAKVPVLLRNSNITKTHFQKSGAAATEPKLSFRNWNRTKTDFEATQLQQKHNSGLKKFYFKEVLD